MNSDLLFCDLAPEDLLIMEVLAIACEIGGRTKGNVQLLCNTLDWNNVLYRAELLEVAPLIYWGLRTSYSTACSVTVGESELDYRSNLYKMCRRAYFITAMRNSVLNEQLAQILQEAGQRRLSLILLKGAYVVECVYVDSGLRSMSDIDILVRREELSDFEKMLHEMGYESYCRVQGLPCLHHEHFHICPLVHSVYPYPVEVHWQLANPNGAVKFDIDGIWRRAKPVVWHDKQVLGLGLEDLLAHLSVHSVYSHKLNARGLRDTCDIALVLNRFSNRIDWDALERIAVSANMVKYLYLSLELARRVCLAEVPDEVMDRIYLSDWELSILRESVNRIFRRKYRLPISSNLAAVASSNLSSVDTIKLIAQLFSKSTLAEIYGGEPNSMNNYVYLPKRLLDLSRKYGRSVIRLCIGDQIAHDSVRRLDGLDKWLA